MAEAREGFVPQVIRGERVPLAGAIHVANEAAALSLGLLLSLSLLIVVGVGLDTVKQIDSQLQQRNYEGFLR